LAAEAVSLVEDDEDTALELLRPVIMAKAAATTPTTAKAIEAANMIRRFVEPFDPAAASIAT